MSEEDPQAPRIPQKGIFDGESESPGSGNVTKNGQVTPLSLMIPTFESVQTLPTPMTYTPPGHSAKSPRQALVISKRRGDAVQAAKEDVVVQHRVVSELFPLPEAAQQRVSSLPTVSESSSTADFSLSARNDLIEVDTVDDQEILTGYMLNRLDVPMRWKKVKQIGSGNFSNVFLYESVDPIADPRLKLVSVKRIKYPEELVNRRALNPQLAKDLLSRLESSLSREISILKSLDYPSIVKLYGINNPVFITSKKPLRDLMLREDKLPHCDMIMSYCSGGDLLVAATSCNGKLEVSVIQRLFSELVMAVKYLHDNNVIHRDLKLENVLLKFPLDAIIDMKDSPVYLKHNLIELADFGLCKKIEPGELCTARCGSEDYVSPEILMGIPYDGRLSDTWALGVILFGLLEDRLPFDPPPNASARQRNRATSHRIARYEWKWFRLLNEDLDAKEIVQHTLTRKSERWRIDQIRESSFVKSTADALPF
ncbi:hypothetical protein HG537_0A03830 [Torulaspora globosa]|uniref:Protein kinase domain-containing protein n=1 Tax=Torulaspora globosa TaxID=48254 RepID=A0A7H9HLC0_9SACH|nr:hypothetical protein HG537_0A03830 [Torulaspora sp. CBS 2947]